MQIGTKKRLPLTKYEHTAQTIIIVPLTLQRIDVKNVSFFLPLPFFVGSGVQVEQPTSGLFHFLRASFFSQLKANVGNILAKTTTLRINLNIDGDPIDSNSHSPITLTNLSSINLVSISRCSSPPHNPVYVRRVGPSDLDNSLASYRHSYIGLLFGSHFITSQYTKN
jgi:hypothetical protein